MGQRQRLENTHVKSSQKQKVAIIGAGISGLSAARFLENLGYSVSIYEKASHIGGRVYSEEHAEGFIFDVGFQVLISSYPELKYWPEIKKIDLKKFNSGAFIYSAHGDMILANPLQHPSKILAETLSTKVNFKDKALVITLIARAHTDRDLKYLSKTKTGDFLKNWGFSEGFIECFWRPFVAGVYLDQKLSMSADFFMFLIKCFSTGQVGVPANGMRQIPMAICSSLKKVQILLNQTVNSFSANQIILSDGNIVNYDAVVCAFDPDQGRRYFQTQQFYFSTEEPLDTDKWLCLVDSRLNLNVNNVTSISEIAPSYAPKGQKLLSVTVLNNEPISELLIEQELQLIMKRKIKLRFLKKYHIKKALPSEIGLPQDRREGVFYCGDYMETPSINGALGSGRKVSQHVNRYLQEKLKKKEDIYVDSQI